MKANHLARGILAASLLPFLLVGCASIDGVTQKTGGVFGAKSDTTARTASGGALLGCAGGAILARVIGGGHDMLKGCVAGGAVGAVAALKIHQQQLADAKKLADEAKAAGAKAQVGEKPETAKADDGTTQTAPVLDRLRIDFPPGDVAQHGAASIRLLTKAAVLADGSQSAETITLEGSEPARAWMAQQVRQALKPGSQVRVVEQAAAAPALVISPVPAYSAGTHSVAGGQ